MLKTHSNTFLNTYLNIHLKNKIKINLTILFFMLSFGANSGYAKEITVEIYKKKFTPAEITIEQGDTVIWINIEKRQYHNVWFKQFDKEEPDYLFPDDKYQRTFDEMGAFAYECGPHPRMTGKVKVTLKK